jgi:microcystin-dependent protein
MATVTGLTAARMLEIEAASVVDGDIVGGSLILTKHDGSQINAGVVQGAQGAPGPQGPQGPAGATAITAIPGEVRLWSGSVLPALATYGKWVWADGAVYVVATYPIAAGHIATGWRTFGGASDPGGSNFRVPDLRGLVAAGLDAMPGGSRANRMTRAIAITLAGKTGEEQHLITIPEMPAHDHPVVDPGHFHTLPRGSRGSGPPSADEALNYNGLTEVLDTHPKVTGITLQNTGGNVAHENVQPTVFVPYIVKLDG